MTRNTVQLQPINAHTSRALQKKTTQKSGFAPWRNSSTWPVAAFLCLTIALLHAMQSWFSYPAFLSLGPFCIEPCEGFSLCMQVICCTFALCVGVGYMVGHGNGAGFAEACLAAALSATSAIGLYLLCYTLLNDAFRTTLLVATALVSALAILDRMAANKHGVPWLASVGLAKPVLYFLASVGFVACAFSGWSLNAYSYELAFPDDQSDRMLAANIDSAVAFFNGDFERQPLDERADNAGSIVLVEANYLGVEGPITVSVEACTGSTVACYDATSNKIAFNTAYLMTEEGRDCVEAAAHETAHAFQWQSCSGKLPPGTATGWPGGFPDEETRGVWARELTGYVSPAFDLSGYMSQSIEKTAYQYGYLSSADIEARVGKYLATGNPEP